MLALAAGRTPSPIDTETKLIVTLLRKFGRHHVMMVGNFAPVEHFACPEIIKHHFIHLEKAVGGKAETH